MPICHLRTLDPSDPSVTDYVWKVPAEISWLGSMTSGRSRELRSAPREQQGAAASTETGARLRNLPARWNVKGNTLESLRRKTELGPLRYRSVMVAMFHVTSQEVYAAESRVRDRRSCN